MNSHKSFEREGDVCERMDKEGGEVPFNITIQDHHRTNWPIVNPGLGSRDHTGPTIPSSLITLRVGVREREGSAIKLLRLYHVREVVW